MNTNVNLEIKTYKEWMSNKKYKTFEDYVQVGDKVDDEFYMHFLNVLPPLIFFSHYLQVNGPCDVIEGKSTYTTFEKECGIWIYKGECFKGQSEDIRSRVNNK